MKIKDMFKLILPPKIDRRTPGQKFAELFFRRSPYDDRQIHIGYTDCYIVVEFIERDYPNDLETLRRYIAELVDKERETERQRLIKQMGLSAEPEIPEVRF